VPGPLAFWWSSGGDERSAASSRRSQSRVTQSLRL
jgi:hypothetical protein